jgi:hypothetical protein
VRSPVKVQNVPMADVMDGEKLEGKKHLTTQRLSSCFVIWGSDVRNAETFLVLIVLRSKMARTVRASGYG